MQPGSCLIFKSRFPAEVSQYVKKHPRCVQKILLIERPMPLGVRLSSTQNVNKDDSSFTGDTNTNIQSQLFFTGKQLRPNGFHYFN